MPTTTPGRRCAILCRGSTRVSWHGCGGPATNEPRASASARRRPTKRGCGRRWDDLLCSPLFQLFQRSRPVVFQEPAKGAVGEHFAAGLAAGAVVGFVLAVDD